MSAGLTFITLEKTTKNIVNVAQFWLYLLTVVLAPDVVILYNLYVVLFQKLFKKKQKQNNLQYVCFHPVESDAQ